MNLLSITTPMPVQHISFADAKDFTGYIEEGLKKLLNNMGESGKL